MPDGVAGGAVRPESEGVQGFHGPLPIPELNIGAYPADGPEVESFAQLDAAIAADWKFAQIEKNMLRHVRSRPGLEFNVAITGESQRGSRDRVQ